MFLISDAYAQAAPAAASGGSGLLQSPLIMIVGMFVVMYFMMIRPQMKRQKEHRALMDALKAGDEVIIAGGIAGKVTKVMDAYITIDVSRSGGNAVEMLVQRQSVQIVLPNGTLKSI